MPGGSGGKEAEDHYEKHHIRKLDTLSTVKAADWPELCALLFFVRFP